MPDGKAVPARVESISKLRAARHGFQLDLVWFEAQIHASAEDVDRRNLGIVWKTNGRPPVSELLDITAGRPKFRIGRIDPVIDSVDETVHSKLRIHRSEPGQNHTFDVGTPVPVGVGQVENVRRGG